MNAEIYNTAEELVGLLKEKKLLIATAESCTGGLVSSYITAVPGSSAVFELGMTSYSCRIKNEALGVKNETLDTLGAVSRDTARQMAECIRKKAAAHRGGTAVCELNINPISREYVREQAAKQLLKLAIHTIEEVF